MKVRGQNSNRYTVKQTAENGQKISGDDETSIKSLVPGDNSSRLQNGLEFDQVYLVFYGRSPTN